MTLPTNCSDKTASADVRMVEISRESVELYKILKFEGLVASGGQAKGVISAGQVLVNGRIETQKRKKIVAGDTIEFDNRTLGIRLAKTVTDQVPPMITKTDPVAKQPDVEATRAGSGATDVEAK